MMKMKLSIFFALFLCVLNLVAASTFVELTGDSIEGYMNDNGNDKIVTLFHSPNCYYCRKFMPAFNEAILKVTKGSIKFAKVDCTDPQSMQLCSRFSVQGYPTVLVLKAGKANGEYNGDRSAEDLYNFCNAL